MSPTSINELWGTYQPEIRKLTEVGAQRLFDDAPTKRGMCTAFKQGARHSRHLTCIDGRVWRGCRLAGSGVLLSRDALGRIIEREKIEIISTHDCCGAARFAFPNVPVEHLDEFVQSWGYTMAQSFGLQHDHIDSDCMHTVQVGDQRLRVPHGFHPEVAIYCDTTGLFRRIHELPIGFVINWKNSPIAQYELHMSMGIALKSGFGDYFSPSHPMSIVVIADNPATLKATLADVTRLVRTIEVRHQSKFKVTGVLQAIFKC